MATLSEIAKAAGVDVSTASRALNGTGKVHFETREKIVEAAKKLEYYSSRMDIRYSDKLMKTVAVISADAKCQAASEIIEVMMERLQAAGYFPLSGSANLHAENLRKYMDIFERTGVAGIILVATSQKGLKRYFENFKKKNDIPIIQVVPVYESAVYDYVKVDHLQAAEMAMGHLIDLGHKRIAFIGDESTEVRNDCYCQMMKKHGLPLREDYIMISNMRYEKAGYFACTKLLDNKERPSAIFAAYDDLAIGAMRAVHESGLSIPEDISMIAIDNIAISSYLYRALTTVSAPIYEVGVIASKIILSKLHDRSLRAIQHVTIKPELHVRETVAQPSR
jgi:DNA-binding LacI/PurR family transcriptional regulator